MIDGHRHGRITRVETHAVGTRPTRWLARLFTQDGIGASARAPASGRRKGRDGDPARPGLRFGGFRVEVAFARPFGPDALLPTWSEGRRQGS